MITGLRLAFTLWTARDLVSWFWGRSLKLLPPHFKAEMHQIRFRLELRPRPRWGSLQRSPRLPSWGPTSKGSGGLGRGKWEGREGEREEGEERKGGEEGKTLRPPWYFEITPLWQALRRYLIDAESQRFSVLCCMHNLNVGVQFWGLKKSRWACLTFVLWHRAATCL